MNKEAVEEYTGECVKIEMIDGSVFEGVLWFVEFEDKTEENVFSIALHPYKFNFLVEDIVKIELVEA